ncbi:MAG: signal peptidase [Actinomycetota bacterium]|nr:signal peptidase [Actinomycetota bacterium]
MNDRTRRAVVETVLLVGLAVIIAIVLRAFVAQAFRIPSASMEPQLLVGDRVVVSRMSYRVHDPRRGDIIVFDCPPAAGCDDEKHDALPVRAAKALGEALLIRQPDTEEFIKRVIGLPGDVVEGHDGFVFVNGSVLVEPYLPKGTVTSDFGPITVRKGKLWVMGDNRGNSADSRVFGQIEQRTIVGRAIVRVWPPNRVAFL